MTLPNDHLYKRFPPVVSFGRHFTPMNIEASLSDYGINGLMYDSPSDSLYDKVAYCINADSPLVDSAHNAITLNGGASVVELVRYKAIKFIGTSALNYLRLPKTAKSVLGANDFTLDMHVYLLAYNANESRLWVNYPGDEYCALNINVGNTGTLSVYMSSNGTTWNLVTWAGPTISLNTEYYLRFVRQGGSMYAVVNGTQYLISSGLGVTSLFDHAADLIIGQASATNKCINGYMRGLRLTVGAARDITKSPTLPFPTR